MTNFPVPLDNLIAFVHSRHPDGEPLDNLADAVSLSAQLDEQADALLGHFVDRARRSGASWTEIGARMGVSKQAARKRFVPRWDGSDPIPEGQLYSRFTLRSRNTLLAAADIADGADAPGIGAAHFAAALPSEPEGLAAKILHQAGITDEQLYAALGLGPADGTREATAEALHGLSFADDGKDVLRGTLKAVLRLGHNYVGTEHLLLGILFAEGSTGATLNSLGLTVDKAEQELDKEIRRVQAERKTG